MVDIQNARSVRVLGLVEKVILGVIAGAAASIGTLEAVFLVGRVVRLSSDELTTLRGVPVETAATGVTDASSLVSSASYETLTLVAEGLPAGIRGLLIAAAVLGSLLTIATCLAVAWLCLRVFLGRPFVASATWAIGGLALVVVLSGLGGSLLASIAHAEAVAFLGLEPQLGPLGVGMDLSALGWGLALAVVAGAFEIGQRLQRETEGLV